jgi:hypothetical protein
VTATTAAIAIQARLDVVAIIAAIIATKITPVPQSSDRFPIPSIADADGLA